LEAGSHDGQLAKDILGGLESIGRCEWHYSILEPSVIRESKQRLKLSSHCHNMQWFRDWESIPEGSFSGIIISNELLDALPVHRLRWDLASKRWHEWGVELCDGRFCWAPMPKTEGVAEALLEQVLGIENAPQGPLLDVLPQGFTIDISPAATQWWHEAARRLKRGYLAAFDYGLEAEELFAPERQHGTLRAYYRHRCSSEVLKHPGFQDLTASVIFPAIRRAGEKAGLKTVFCGMQSDFFMRLFEQILLEKGGDWLRDRSRQIKTLIHPDHLGRAFRVLVQSKDEECA
jgi:SAM-dependent MidA family methyltransferase